jgi:hypothetical protein
MTKIEIHLNLMLLKLCEEPLPKTKVAAKALKVLGSSQLIGELKLQPDQSYFMFAKHDLHIAEDQKRAITTT